VLPGYFRTLVEEATAGNGGKVDANQRRLKIVMDLDAVNFG
jgi:hypothetical protein